MNKILLTTLGLVAALSAYAQGTFNASNNYIPTGASSKAFILDKATGNPVTKATGKVQIINVASGETLSPNGTAGVSLTLDGLFFINGLVVPGSPTGSSAQILVRAWDSATGATWDTALNRSPANSGLITVNSLGGGTTPAATFAQNSNFVGLTIEFVPEPSTIALAALGVAGLFFVVRRKNS
jgi:hypothetical protein